MKHNIFLFAMLFLAISNINLYAESDTLWTTQIGSTVRTVKFSPDGRYVYAAAQGRGPLKLDAQNGAIINEYQGFKFETAGSFNYSLNVSADGEKVYASDKSSNIYIWSSDSINPQIIKNTKYEGLNSYSKSIDLVNNYLAMVINYDDVNNVRRVDVQIWDLNTNTIIKQIPDYRITKLHFSKDGRFLALANIDYSGPSKPIDIYETTKWEKYGALGGESGHKSFEITDLSFSPDGSLLASCDSQLETKLWRLDKKNLILDFKPFKSSIDAIHLLENNKIALAGVSIFDWRLQSSNLFPLEEVKSYYIYVRDFDFYKNEKVVITNSLEITLLKADRLTSVQFNINNDKLFPNPANNNLIIPKSYFNENFQYFNIIDINGKEVYRYNKSMIINFNEDLLVDVSRYVKGTYIVQLFYTTNIQTLKFIKE